MKERFPACQKIPSQKKQAVFGHMPIWDGDSSTDLHPNKSGSFLFTTGKVFQWRNETQNHRNRFLIASTTPSPMLVFRPELAVVVWCILTWMYSRTEGRRFEQTKHCSERAPMLYFTISPSAPQAFPSHHPVLHQYSKKHLPTALQAIHVRQIKMRWVSNTEPLSKGALQKPGASLPRTDTHARWNGAPQTLPLCNYNLHKGRLFQEGSLFIRVVLALYLPSSACLVPTSHSYERVISATSEAAQRNSSDKRCSHFMHCRERTEPFPYAKGEQAKCKPFIPNLHSPRTFEF